MWHPPIWLSLAVIAGVLAVTVALSLGTGRGGLRNAGRGLGAAAAHEEADRRAHEGEDRGVEAVEEGGVAGLEHLAGEPGRRRRRDALRDRLLGARQPVGDVGGDAG